MKDRFKFRVFGLCCNSKLEKNWVNITEVGNFFIDKDGKLIDESAYFDPINHPEHFIVEQCTGLKDNCGNLIYEGDLIKSPNNSHPLAVYHDTTGLWRCKENRPNGIWELPLYDMVRNYTVEIIGNIHEQAEQKDK